GRLRRGLLGGLGEQAHRAGDAGAAQAAVAVGVLGEVLLVAVLGVEQGAGGGDLGGDVVVAGLGELLGVGVAGAEGGVVLGGVGVVDRRAVLDAHVVALAHALGGVVRLPERGEQGLVGDQRGVVDDQHD